MFELLSFHALQVYWWFIISLLAGLLVFMMFVQGGQTLLDTLSQNELEKTILVNSLGRKWELGFTTLVLFGGAMFAAFPQFYATSFGGAYWLWLMILFSFIIQAVSYEYRTKPDNFLGQKVYEAFLKINGYVGVFLLGVAISTFISGAPFHLDDMNFAHWDGRLRGLEALANPLNFLLSLSLIFLVRIIACMYFINNIDQGNIVKKAKHLVVKNFLVFLPLFLGFLIWVIFSDGVSIKADGNEIVEMKYLFNLLSMPWLLVLLLVGVIFVVLSVYITSFKNSDKGIFFIGLGVVLVVLSLFLTLGLNDTAFYPSTSSLQSSLHLANASGSHYTLTAMGYASLLIPFVLGYIIITWRAMDKHKITESEMQDENAHNY